MDKWCAGKHTTLVLKLFTTYREIFGIILHLVGTKVTERVCRMKGINSKIVVLFDCESFSSVIHISY